MANPVLEARVRGVNRANEIANKLYVDFRRVLEPFFGQKVIKSEGGLMKKVQDAINTLQLPSTVQIHVYRYQSDYSLCWTVKTCESVPKGEYSHAYYHETTVYVAELAHKHTLSKWYDPPQFKTDYKAADVQAAREKFKDAQKALDDARSALVPFGEYDR